MRKNSSDANYIMNTFLSVVICFVLLISITLILIIDDVIGTNNNPAFSFGMYLHGDLICIISYKMMRYIVRSKPGNNWKDTVFS